MDGKVYRSAGSAAQNIVSGIAENILRRHTKGAVRMLGSMLVLNHR